MCVCILERGTMCVYMYVCMCEEESSLYGHEKSVAVCCSVLQCVAVCCSVLQCVEECSSVLYVWKRVHCESTEKVLQWLHMCVGSVLHMCVAACCSLLQCVAAWCSVLQMCVVCRNTLQQYGLAAHTAKMYCAKEPLISAKEPCICAAEPHSLTNPPQHDATRCNNMYPKPTTSP